MPHVEYTYPATATINDVFDGSSLDKEIRKRVWTGSAFIGLTVDGTGNTATVHIWFTLALTEGDEAILDGLIAAHPGIQTVTTQTPREIDGKPIVVITPGTVGWLTWFHGAGDQLSPLIRGGGQALELSFTATGLETVEWSYAEPIELHDGQMQMEGTWSVQDRLDFIVRLPATIATVNGTNTGNANRVAIGGGLYMYIPASGDGGYDIDLATAVPVPSRPIPTGYWNVEYDTGEVSASPTPGQAKYNLFSFEAKSYLMRRVPLGPGTKVLDVDVYRTDMIHPKWFLRVEITKAVHTALQTERWAAWLLAFRRFTALS